MTSKQIIEKVKEEKHFRSVRALELALGKRVGFLADIVSGKKEISEKAAACILTVFPDISREWLMTGEGYMYNDQAQKEIQETEFKKREELYITRIEELKKQVAELEKQHKEDSETIRILVRQNDKRPIITAPTFVHIPEPTGVAEHRDFPRTTPRTTMRDAGTSHSNAGRAASEDIIDTTTED